MEPNVSVIVPFYKNLSYLRECLEHCLRLDYPNYEIIVVSSSPLNLGLNGVKLVITHGDSQGVKKDMGVAHATGEICAFIDDDAYPAKDWLKNAVKYFSDSQVAAVCGPGVTPANDSPRQIASGVIYSCFFGSGPLRFRYVPTKLRYVDEAPGYNLFIRRSVLVKLGGFATNLRSGEDTLMSHKIRSLGLKILYAPDVIVYHHRRPLFLPHLKQVRNYALHRGFFAKTFKGPSLNLIYFLSLMVLTFTILAAVMYLAYNLVWLLSILISAYLFYGFLEGLKTSKNMFVALLVSIGLPMTHLTYSISFVQGLLSPHLKERPSY